MSYRGFREFAVECAREAGEILTRYRGRIGEPTIKESASSVVTEADLAAERRVVERILREYPAHGIIAEESGVQVGSGEYVWVIDPLDGTSNFVAGLPWFGFQMGLLERGRVVASVMHLPVEGLTYWAELGGGAFRDGQRLALTEERRLSHVLCAFGLDPSQGPEDLARDAALLCRVGSAVRNLRMTNSLVDFCLTLDGHLGGFVNLSPKIWDIVPICLMMPEAGGVISDPAGQPISFEADAMDITRTFPLVGASRALHSQLIAQTREWLR
ncbi:MAG: inositol monophosphatase [Verrucomicrobiales bacterium]|nr:inositol monophosphatase [Verrucomicrobiales bacterium]